MAEFCVHYSPLKPWTAIHALCAETNLIEKLSPATSATCSNIIRALLSGRMIQNFGLYSCPPMARFNSCLPLSMRACAVAGALEDAGLDVMLLFVERCRLSFHALLPDLCPADSFLASWSLGTTWSSGSTWYTMLGRWRHAQMLSFQLIQSSLGLAVAIKNPPTTIWPEDEELGFFKFDHKFKKLNRKKTAFSQQPW